MWSSLEDKRESWEAKLDTATSLLSKAVERREGGKIICIYRWCRDVLATIYKKNMERNSFIGRYWSLVHASLVACEEGGCGVSDVVDQSLVKTITTGMEQESCDVKTWIFKCLHLILSSKPAPFIPYELLLSLTAVACTVMETDSEQMSTVKLLLHQLVYQQSIHGNPKKVFLSSCKQLLKVVLELRAHLKMETTEVVGQIVEVTRQLVTNLFSSDHLVEYSSVLTERPHPQASDSRVVACYTATLWDTLDTILMTSPENPLRQETLSLLPELLDNFATQNRLLKKLPSIMEFQFFAKLLSLIGFDIALKDGGTSKKNLNKMAVSPEALEQEENDDNDDGDRSDESDNSDDDGDGRRRSKKAKVVIVEESLDPDLLRDAETHIQCLALRVWSQGLEQEEEDNEHVAIDTAVCHCIDTVQQLGVYQITDDACNGGGQLVQLQQLCAIMIKRLGKDIQSLNHCFHCLSTLLPLNHHIISPFAQTLWLLLISIASEYRKELVYVEQFGTSMVSHYSKLHQLPVLVEHIVGAVRTILDSTPTKSGHISPTLFPATESSLRSSLKNLQVVYFLQIAELLLKELNGYYLPLLSELETTPPEKKRRKSKGGSKSKMAVVWCIHCVVDLLFVVISEAPIDAFGEGRHVERARDIVDSLIGNVYQRVMMLARDDVEVREVALHVLLMCVQLYHTLSAVYPGKFSDTTVLDSLCVVYNDGPVPGLWKDTETGMEYSPLAQYLMRAVLLYQLRFSPDCVVHSDGVWEFLLPTFISSSCDAWNGQALDISSSNCLTASYRLFLMNIYFIASSIPSSAWNSLASLFVIGLSPKQNCPGLSLVVRDAMELSLFEELKELHRAMMSEVISKSNKFFPKQLCDYKCESLQSIHDYYPVENSEATYQNILDILKMAPSLKFNKKIEKKIEKFLQFLPSAMKIVSAMPCGSYDSHVIDMVYTVCSWCAATAAVLHLTSSSDWSVLKHGLQLVSRCLGNVASLWRRRPDGRKSGPEREHAPKLKLAFFLSFLLVLSEENQLKDVEASILMAAEKTIQCMLAMCLPLPLIDKIHACDVKFDMVLLHSIKKFNKKSSKVAATWEELCEIAEQHIATTSDTVLHCEYNSIVPHINEHREHLFYNVLALPTSCLPKLFCNEALKASDSEDHLVLEEVWAVHQEWLMHICSTNTLELLESNIFGSICGGDNIIVSKVVVVSAKILSSMATLATLCDRGQLRGIFEKICSLVTVTDEIKLENFACFFICWQGILDAPLSQEGRMELRKWMNKVVVLSIKYVTSVTSYDDCSKLVIVHALRLLQKLSSITAKVGLGKRSVTLSFHIFMHLPNSVLITSNVLEAAIDLLLTIIKVHSGNVAEATPPILGIMNNIIAVVVEVGQTFHEKPHYDNYIKSLRGFVQLLEQLARQDWFKKYVVYCLAQYITETEKAPLNFKIKDILVLGVIPLFKLLEEKELLYLKSSVDEHTRERVQKLHDQFHKHYQFKGKA